MRVYWLMLLLVAGTGGQHVMNEGTTGEGVQVQVMTGLDEGNLTAGLSNTLEVMIHASNGTAFTPSDLTISHDRVLHLVVIGRDLSTFMHMHPEDFGYTESTSSRLPLELRFPYSGEYLMGFDGALRSGGEFHAEPKRVTVKGSPAMPIFMSNFSTSVVVRSFLWPKHSEPIRTVSLQQLLQPPRKEPLALPPAAYLSNSTYRVNITSMPEPLVANSSSDIKFLVLHAANGSVVVDMVPLLGADAHIAVVAADFSFYEHSHAMLASSMKSSSTSSSMSGMDMGVRKQELVADITFPAAGVYRLVLQMARGAAGKELIFVPLMSTSELQLWHCLLGTPPQQPMQEGGDQQRPSMQLQQPLLPLLELCCCCNIRDGARHNKRASSAPPPLSAGGAICSLSSICRADSASAGPANSFTRRCRRAVWCVGITSESEERAGGRAATAGATGSISVRAAAAARTAYGP